MSGTRGRVDTPPPKPLKRKAHAFKPVLSPRVENHSSPPPYQDECFTPKRSLKRSPPPSSRKPPQQTPPDLTQSSKPDPGNGRGSDSAYELGRGKVRSVQDECFTPRRSIRRSPAEGGAVPLRAREKENDGSPELAKRRENKQEAKRQVKQKTSTAPAAAERADRTRQTAGKSEDNLIDAAPPVKRWEIPRTPDPLLCTPTAQPLMDRITEETPTIAHTPSKANPNIQQPSTHQSAQSSKSSTYSPPMKAAQLPNFSPRIASPAIRSHPLHTSHTAHSFETPSPPLSAATDPVSVGLSGLVCTEEDLAFLQRRKHVKQYEQLQLEKAHLHKSLKNAAEQKEQLQHEAMKIDSDVERMRHKYRGTVTEIQSLLSSPSSQTAVVNPAALLAPNEPHITTQGDNLPATPQLTGSKVTKLKRVNQLKAIQSEKVGKELQSKLTEVGEEREQVQQLIACRELKQREQQAKLDCTKKEQTVLDEKLQQVSGECASMQDKVVQLESELARLQLGGREEEEGEGERRSAEERLKAIIRQCELCVKREQMLKQLGV